MVLSTVPVSCFLQVIFLEVVVYSLSVLKNFRVSCLASRADIIHRYLISFKDNYYKFWYTKWDKYFNCKVLLLLKKSKDGRDLKYFLIWPLFKKASEN
jgi:hypothetical protein